MLDEFWCKHCQTQFLVRYPLATCDVLVNCPECGWKHPRQIAAGIAVSCDPPTSTPINLYKYAEL